MSGKNIYSDMSELIQDYYEQIIGNYLNQTVTINDVSLTCDIYRVIDGAVLTSAVFAGCTAVDANTQIIVGANLSVASGTTLTPPYRCKGIIIGSPGKFTNLGTISMTARGASATGKNIQLTSEHMISAVGGTGGAGQSNVDANGIKGNSPASGVLSCGGGGSGSCIRWTNQVTSYKGGNGTSFSGGTGSGGAYGPPGSDGDYAASDTGGKGGSRVRISGVSMADTFVLTGGAGNPKGVSTYTKAGSGVSDGRGNGTGGLVVILTYELDNQGSIVANGVQAEGVTSSSQYDVIRTGGSSGGGCVVVISRTVQNQGTLTANGGVAPTIVGSSQYKGYGGAGGNGTATSLTLNSLLLVQPKELELGFTESQFIDDIEFGDGRFIGIIDKDELYYELRGVRHRASTGHYIQDNEGTAVTRRNNLVINSPLNATDDSENEATVIGADTSGALDFTQIKAPGTAGQEVGHIYSTDETVVGKWIDGRNVYEKTYANLPTGSSIAVSTWGNVVNVQSLNIDRLIEVQNNSFSQTVIYNVFWRINDNYLQAYSASNAHAHERVTIRYTKTTDTV